MARFLFHPLVTLTATGIGLGSAAAACIAIVAAIEPVTHLPLLNGLIPLISRIDGDLIGASVVLTALSGICNAIAGAGRSFIKAIDNPTQV